MSFLIALGMSMVMSLVMVAVNLGVCEHFTAAWLRAWITGMAVGFPAAAAMVPLARKVVAYLTKSRA